MKTITITHGKRIYQLDRYVGDLSLPLNFHGLQPNAYGAPAATAVPYSGEGFVLDTRQGGSCNCDTITITPHCNGTHTECIGHVLHDREYVTNGMPCEFCAATLISVTPNRREITADMIAAVKYDTSFLEALVVRTLPNDESKKTRHWENDTTPYFTPEAMKTIRTLGVEHLLVDLPSIDPLYDGGKLAAHRAFWGMQPGSHDVPDKKGIYGTITEMIFVKDSFEDGRYFLTIQIPRFYSDAAPSRPLLYSIGNQS